ncbi:Hypothetical predicted protein [Paramuricea clavata]|uniref:Uncharacterized protein n=1 Tax=Paramuricea clavata TaxID=317549 RepID=A0A6S7LPK8_PARCT|nr:Hypothetical predicted protein [Paramuricea clavata]
MAHQEWQTKFDDQFSDLDHLWNLEIVSNVEQGSGWLKMQCKGMARFDCSTCNNRWTSVNGGAIFRYRLSRSQNERRGNVKLFLGGQKCKKCDDVFETAKWADSDVERVITELLSKVQQKFYGRIDVPTTSATENRYIPADMSAPHQKSLCQFCTLGVCQYSQQNDIDSIASDLEHFRF